MLIIVGINTMNFFRSDASRLFTGSPTDKAIWMFIGGMLAAVLGQAGTLRGVKAG